MDYNEILNILQANEDKNFVQRILQPDKYPTLPRPDLGEGYTSTHVMSWGEGDFGSIVYPQVIQDEVGKLKMLAPRDAYDYAIKNNQFIKFDDPTKADIFSKEYKKYWNVQDQLNTMNKSIK